MKNLTITEDQFISTYKPVKNPFNPNASWDGAMLETYGQEHEHVQKAVAAAPGTVWTVLDCDGSLIVGSGYHHVNRIGYILTEVPVPEGQTIETIDEDADGDE